MQALSQPVMAHDNSSKASADADKAPAPKFVNIELLYRGAGKEKNFETYSLKNDLELTEQQVEEWAKEHLVTDDVLAVKYGLPNIAKGEYEDDICGQDGSPFLEITECYASDEEELEHDEPFSTIFHAMIGDKGVEKWSDLQTAAKAGHVVHCLDLAQVALNNISRPLNREEKDQIGNQIEVLLLKLMPAIDGRAEQSVTPDIADPNA